MAGMAAGYSIRRWGLRLNVCERFGIWSGENGIFGADSGVSAVESTFVFALASVGGAAAASAAGGLAG